MAVGQKQILIRWTETSAAAVADDESEQSVDALLVGGCTLCRHWQGTAPLYYGLCPYIWALQTWTGLGTSPGCKIRCCRINILGSQWGFDSVINMRLLVDLLISNLTDFLEYKIQPTWHSAAAAVLDLQQSLWGGVLQSKLGACHTAQYVCTPWAGNTI